MRKILLIVACTLVPLAMLLASCEKKESSPTKTTQAGQKAPVTLCAHCGEIKGSEKCCRADAVKCTACGLNKGASACCKNIDFSQGSVQLCPKCGQGKGSEKCCAADAAKCPACGLNKGAPGCCSMAS